MDKKQIQLGMNPSTASGRLIKDLLFDFINKLGYVCYRCKQPLSRETFSVEHIIPWLDSEDPVKMFFDVDNISYSHLRCNVADARKPSKKYANIAEYRAVNFANHYAKNKEVILKKKRERYHNSKLSL